MWHPQFEALDRQTLRLRLVGGQQVLAYSEVIELWRSDGLFRRWFNGVLADVPFAAYFWESLPIIADTAGREFECVLLSSDALADLNPDPASFAMQFESLTEGEVVATFPNLAGDATLVVPRPVAPESAYGHLAAFVRQAPAGQVQSLWQAVGDALAQCASSRPIWLSTAGLGVPWLHVRLDTRPKYYRYEQYRKIP